MADAYIALGSNLAYNGLQPRELLRAAIEVIGTAGTVTRVSSLYRTEPVALVSQPSYFNAVAALSTDRPAEDLMRELLRIERQFGRERIRQHKDLPRTLDLDLLLYGNRIESTYLLELPHPRLHERRFVLEPLVEIAPELVHPVRLRTMRQLYQELPISGPNRPDAVAKVEESGSQPWRFAPSG